MATPDAPDTPYLVLARKYRPSSFAGLIGQEAMVQTLRNAFASGRIPHAFILTGIRGVGKTTTARILARAFNYEDAAGRRPNLDFEAEGLHDKAIIEGRHVDVQELDAASNTGIDAIREINDMTRTPPMSAPYKVFIIDEVHMLSNAAFNGLLKTLEEPPPYVKFIFATTEIRKVPVTILSRCMRFDLRRIAPEVMSAHLASILEREAIACEPEAMAMIVRAGEGSVRDCLSLLDQAISHGNGVVTAGAVRDMLGLADRAVNIDLFEAVMAGRMADALDLFRRLYDAGADPQTVLTDLAEFTHLVTRIKVVPAAADDASLTLEERKRGADFAARLGMRVLSRAWQILFQGLEEVGKAANALQAAEMVLIRLGYAADLPTPDELIARLSGSGAAPAAAPPSAPRGVPAPAQAHRAAPAAPQAVAVSTEPVAAPAAPLAGPTSFLELIELARSKRDILLVTALESAVRPVSFAEGRIELSLVPGADPGIVQMLSGRLQAWTGRKWWVTVATGSAPAPAPTLREEREARASAEIEKAKSDPLVRAVLDAFPGATVTVYEREEQVPIEAYEDSAIPDFEEDDD